MGLLNARNLRKAKQLLDKNRHKVGDVVGKAATKLDAASGGKTANISKKAEEAARKYSAGGATNHGVHVDAASDGQNLQYGPTGTMSPEEMQLRQAEANAAAAAALANAANAATGLLNRAAQMQAEAGGPTPAWAKDLPTSNSPAPDPSDAAGSSDNPPPLDAPPPLDG